MDSEAFESAARELLDLNFQSLAMKHIDLKQMELDTAAAKVDELTKQLESLWSDSPAPATPPPQASVPARLTRYSSSPTPDHFSRTSSPRKVADSGDATYTRSENSPAFFPYSPLSPKGRPASPRTPLYLSPESYSPLERAPLPTAQNAQLRGCGWLPGPGSIPQALTLAPCGLRGLPLSLGVPTPGTRDDLTLRRRPPKSWNESDLDVAYEKKSSSQTSSYERLDVFGGPRPSSPSLQLLPWRESSLDGLGGPGKDSLTSSTLPRNYKVSPLASDRRAEVGGYRRSSGPGVPGTLPRSWQPASRIVMPPTSPQTRGAPRQRPIPLSMIFKLQNAFWEYGAAKAGPPGSPIITRAPLPKVTPQVPAPPSPVPAPPPQSSAQPAAPQLVPPARPPGGEGPPKPLEEPEPEPELEGLLAPALEVVETEEGAVPRPLSPTRLQPALPPEAQTVPELEEVARVLAEIPRPLKRRGSMEQSPGPALPPTHKKQYQQLINRLFHRHGGSGGGPPRDGAAGPGGPEPELPSITEGAEARAGPPAPAPPTPTLLPPSLPDPPPPQSTEMRSVLRKGGSPRKARRARLNPLVLLLDAALTGELDVVQQAVKEMNDPSQPNEEGITALHNAICGANYAIVDFLIGTGANVNSPDSHGWTPLHCAASCNDTAICTALVQHGAAIFATTLSDGAMAIEKCDPYREGYADCATYLAEAEQSMGHLHGGAVYALWDYSAEFGDELSFREGEPVTVLRRDGPEETDWWWAALRGQEGYVPRNYFGLFPRVKPQRGKV
uniref:Protein phosphatase 1 regulatory subunit 13 like n=1 Tax=Monodelphis domestica TaxID=13616 RepID=F7DF17_MONDO